MICSNDYKVTNTSAGVLGGNAWNENVGWIQFAPTNGGVTIDSSGNFSGYAWGESIGWIVFNCSSRTSCDIVDYKISTDWRPVSARAVTTTTTSPVSRPSGGGGLGSRTPGRSIDPITRQIATVNVSLLAPAASSPSPPAVLILTKIRERLLTRIDQRLENVTSVPAKKILEGIRERLLKRIDARIRNIMSTDQ